MRSYWRSVWACMPASWAATEMTKTGASSGTSPRRVSAITALRGGQSAERGRDRRARIVCLRGGVLLQGLARLGGHLLRHRDLDGDEQIARAGAALGEAPTAHPQRRAGLRARRDAQRDRAVQGGHPQRRTERGLGVGHRHGQSEVVAAAPKQVVRVDVDRDEQVAGRAAASAGHALAPDAKPRTVTDAGGYPHVDRAGLRRDARAEAVGAGVVDDLARAAAVAARLAEPERTLVAADESRAAAGRADVWTGAGPGAAAVAGPAGTGSGQLQRKHGAVHGLVESEAYRRLDVGASRRPDVALAARGRPAGEQAAEDVAEPAGPGPGAATATTEEVGHGERRAAGRPTGEPAAEAAPAEQCPRLVVLLAAAVVGEHVVCLGHVLELCLGVGVTRVLVRMQLTSELAIGLLDVGGRGVLGYAQRFVVVLLDVVPGAHRASPPLVVSIVFGQASGSSGGASAGAGSVTPPIAGRRTRSAC